MRKISSCAMYVDGDGVPLWLIEQAVSDVRERCDRVSIRVYKDWLDPGNGRLMASLWNLDAELAQVTPRAGLKNGTDIALTVDVIDALHNSPSEAVALVANDGDFSALAERLSHAGTVVLGYGSRDASSALTDACEHFVRFDPATRTAASHADKRSLDQLITEAISLDADDHGWVMMMKFGSTMLGRYGLRASDSGSRSWSVYLATNLHFDYVPIDRTTARVRVRLADAA